MGSIPWSGVSEMELMRRQQQREKLSRATLCPSEMYDVMLGCWRLDAGVRISADAALRDIERFSVSIRCIGDDAILLEWPASNFGQIGIRDDVQQGIDLQSDDSRRQFTSLTVSADCVTTESLLGSGAFGSVFNGTVTLSSGKKLDVAVKTMSTDGGSEIETRQFEYEARLLSALSHPKIVSVLAVCFEGSRRMMMLELMVGGDLRSYLSQHQEEVESDVVCLNDVCFQVSSAMAYLEGRRVVHRDLAARFISHT